jgi:RHS repeat-associated protein
MKFTIVLATLLLTALAPVWAADPAPVSGSTIHNPKPADCCSCVELWLVGEPTKNGFGNFEINIRGKIKDEDRCSEVKFKDHYELKANGVATGGTLFFTTDGGKGFVALVVVGAKTLEKLGPNAVLTFEVFCSPDAKNAGSQTTNESTNENLAGRGCKISFKIGDCGYLTECQECTQGSPSVEQKSFNVSIPTTRSLGGHTAGDLNFRAPNFANPGRSALVANLPSEFTVNRDANGIITSIETGNTTMTVADAPMDIMAEDPNAFTVTHKDKANNIFRTTNIYFINEGGVSRMRMDTTFDGATFRNEQTQPVIGTLVLEKGRVVGNVFEPLWQETLIKDESIPDKRIHRRIIKERTTVSAAWGNVSDIETTEENQVNEWVKTKEVIDKDGEALTSTWTYYQPGEITGPGASTEGLGRLKRFSSYDGDESFHLYSLHSETVMTPYAGNIAGKTTTNSWDPVNSKRTIITQVGGVILSKSETIHTDTAITNVIYTSEGNTLTRTTHQVPVGQDFGGHPLRINHPNGTLTTYAYSREVGGGYTTVTENGSTINGTAVSQGMRKIVTKNSRGTIILSKSEVIGYGSSDGTTFDLMAVTSVDDLGRALVTAYHPVSALVVGESASASNPAWTTSVEYTCCGVSKETDMYGVTTYYAYDNLQRRIKSNSLGVTHETHYNGLSTETHRYAETVSASLSPALQGTNATLVSKSTKNLSGTLQESWTPDPTTTTNGSLVKSTSTTTYQPAAGLSSRTVTTTADNNTQTTDNFLDGRTFKTYGDLSPAMEHAYTVNAIGEVISESYIDGTSLKETTTTQSDWAGRTLSNTYMDGAIATTEYNAIGQVVKYTDPDGVLSLMTYDALGKQIIGAVDLNNNGVIDYGVDNVTSSESAPALDNANNPVWKSISKIWQPGDTSPTGGTIVSTSFSSPNGLTLASESIGVSNPSTQITTLSGNGNWTSTSTSPDGTKKVEQYTAGRLVSSSFLNTENLQLVNSLFGYDSLNRLVTTTDSRTGTSTTTYLSNTADVVVSLIDTGNRVTSFTYDILGRQVSVNAPDTLDADGNTLTNVTTTTYNPDNTIAETNGDQTYRVSHTYDYADRQISMTTHGTETATTIWQYSPERGFLLAKRDAANKGADYTYTAAGRLASRTWARGVVTTNSYDDGGRLVATNYSDTTPDIVMSYDAMGRQTTLSNGVASSTFSYNSGNLQIDTEIIAYDLNSDNTIDFTRIIDRSQDGLSRDNGWQLKHGTTVENEVVHTYGTTDGRLASISKGASVFAYTYVPNSNLIATVTSPIHTVTNVYETTRDELASKVNKKLDTTTVSSYLYTLNNYSQRTGVNTGGTAFTGSPSWAWGYNNKGEIVKADSSESSLDRVYAYDGIGNRTSGGDHGSPISYTANALNQYSAIGSLNPVHDDDGNMTSGPLPANVNANSALVWDAENRLIEAQVNSGATVNFVYDSQSRRIAETVGSATTVYVYDGWNPIAEYSTSYALTKTYTWGLDSSGSMQDAGGVGGLLAVSDNSGTHYPTFDGNGNVSEYLDSSGNTVAHYEYDPFGKTTVATGSKVNDFAHRFSTKPLEATTGLYYYGYRFYDPETGRWPSRDPIEEQGGQNLYGFVNNNPINGNDVLGLKQSWFAAKIVSKSFINGVVPVNRGFYPDRAKLNAYAALSLLLNFRGIKPFQQNPFTDAKDQTYRLFSQLDLKFCCEGNKLLGLSMSEDKDGGLEGAIPVPIMGPGGRIVGFRSIPFYGTMNLSTSLARVSPSSYSVDWKGWGKPHPILAEPSLQAVGFRLSTKIWHKGKVTVSCRNGKGYYHKDSYTGSKFPSHKLWINGIRKDNIRQHYLSDLWVSDPTDPSFVK